MNKKAVYTCEVCSALYVCLKYFQEHRKKHAIQEGRIIYPCTHCLTVLTSASESRLHSESHKNEQPHTCDICQEMLGISEEEVLGTRRSVGTTTEFHVYNLSLDKPLVGAMHHQDTTTMNDNGNGRVGGGVGGGGAHHHHHHHHQLDHHDNNNDDDDDDDDDDEDDDEDENDDEEEDEDDDDVDDEDDDEDDDEEDDDEDEDDEEEEEEEGEHAENKELAICKQNVTNIIYVSNQTINHTTTSQQKNSFLKPSRPSRSTGKGKGNRKARLTNDGDIRRKFSCCHCGKSFKTKSHLQRHILTHTGEKPYHCNRCDCRFNQSSSLRNHVIAIHTKEYPHTCNNCSKGFLMPAVLQKHLQTSECGKSNQVVEGL